MLALVPTLVAVFAPVGPGDPLDYVDAHRRADAALTRGDLEQASAAFEACLERSPQNPAAAYGMACALARSGEEHGALAWLERAAEWGYADGAVALWDEDLARLRSTERFAAAVAVMNSAALGRPARHLWILDERNNTCSTDAALDASGRVVAVGRTDGRIQLLDARTGAALDDSASLGSSEVWSLAPHPTRALLAALTWDGNVHLWTLDDHPPRTIGRLPGSPELGELSWTFGSTVAFDPSGERLLVGAAKRGVRLFDADGELVRAWDEVLDGFFSSGLAWSGTGAEFAHHDDERVQFFDGRTGEERGRLESSPEIRSIAFAPDDSLVATGHEETIVRVWRRETLELLFERVVPGSFWADPPHVNSLAFSPDGRLLAVGTGESAALAVYDTTSGERVREYDLMEGHFAEPFEIRWSSDASRFWFAYVCGGALIQELELARKKPHPPLLRGRSPRIGASGRGVSANGSGVTLLDARSARYRWRRPNLARPGEIVQTPAGYFTGTVVDLAELVVQPGTWEQERDPATGNWVQVEWKLSSVVEPLFDPKRVRAARAGVPLAGARL